MDTQTIFSILAVLGVIWLIIRPNPSRGKGSPKAKATVSGSKTRTAASGVEEDFHWPPLGAFDFQVVGESNYQNAIASIAGDHGQDSASTECTAVLVPEDDNRFDPKAVAVQISGRKVGYLSRDDARSFRRRLGQKGLSGATTTCAACVVGGGTRRNGEKLFYGVRLDIKPFE